MSEAREEQFDDVFLGSSFLCLAAAVFASDMGKRVAILEKDHRLGGAWSILKEDPVFGSIEYGCHIFAPTDNANRDDGFYSFLVHRLGLSLVNLNPQPLFFDQSVGAYAEYHPGRLFRYFADGLPGFLLAIENLLEANSVVVCRNFSVTDLRVDNDTVRTYSDKQVICSERIHFPSFFGVESAELFGERLEFGFESRTCYHVLLKFSSPGQDYSYYHSIEPSLSFDKVINLTPFYRNLCSDGSAIACARVSKQFKKLSEASEFASRVLDDLTVVGNATSESRLIAARVIPYTSAYRTEPQLRALECAAMRATRFSYLRSIDVVDCFQHCAYKHQNIGCIDA